MPPITAGRIGVEELERQLRAPDETTDLVVALYASETVRVGHGASEAVASHTAHSVGARNVARDERAFDGELSVVVGRAEVAHEPAKEGNGLRHRPYG